MAEHVAIVVTLVTTVEPVIGVVSTWARHIVLIHSFHTFAITLRKGLVFRVHNWDAIVFESTHIVLAVLRESVHFFILARTRSIG